MGYTNSKMVAYTKLSPNHSGQRTHTIDLITPHCVVGQCTAEGLGDWFAKSSTQASSKGIFTILEVKSGQGSDAGWGRLKSGAGWISLDYTTRI